MTELDATSKKIAKDLIKKIVELQSESTLHRYGYSIQKESYERRLYNMFVVGELSLGDLRKELASQVKDKEFIK